MEPDVTEVRLILKTLLTLCFCQDKYSVHHRLKKFFQVL